MDEKECQVGGGRNGDNSELIFSKNTIVLTVIIFPIVECVLAAGDLARNTMLRHLSCQLTGNCEWVFHLISVRTRHPFPLEQNQTS